MKSNIDLLKLSPLQRIILIYNGTLTKLLENLIDEQIVVIKHYEQIETNELEIPFLDLPAGQSIVHRKVFLQGQSSGINWLYAEAIIVLDRLHPLFYKDLLDSDAPIGKLWIKYRIETFKELLEPFEEAADKLAIHFGIKSDDKLFGRTYRVFSQQQPIMMLTEKFPSHYFTQVS